MQSNYLTETPVLQYANPLKTPANAMNLDIVPHYHLSCICIFLPPSAFRHRHALTDHSDSVGCATPSPSWRLEAHRLKLYQAAQC
jgi:hypothetical protein